MEIIHSIEVSLFFTIIPENTDAFDTSWKKLKISVTVYIKQRPKQTVRQIQHTLSQSC